MTPSIMIALSFCICQLFLLRATAFALDDKELINTIREHGILEFARHTMDSSRALQYFVSEQQRKDNLEAFARYSKGQVKEVRASTIYSTPAVECTVVETIDEAYTNILVILRASEREDSTFDLTLTNLNSASIADAVARVYQVLENAEMDVSVVDVTRKAIDDMLRNGDVKFLDDLEKRLASRATVLPKYISERLQEKSELSRKRSNTSLDILRATNDVRYLVTKKLLGNHVVASFGVPTWFGPLVFSVHFLLLETGPVICSTWFEGGVSALPYMNDYRRVFSSERSSSGPGSVK